VWLIGGAFSKLVLALRIEHSALMSILGRFPTADVDSCATDVRSYDTQNSPLLW
jgi:hypothetical protein